MGACCEKTEDESNENNENYKIIDGEVYRQSQHDNDFLRLYNYEELKRLLNELLTKIKAIYWHQYEDYLKQQLEEIQRYKQYIQQIQGYLRQQLFLEIMDAKFHLPEQILQNYQNIKIEVQINRQSKEKCIKFVSQEQQIFLDDVQKRSEIQLNKQKKWVYWNQFKNFNLQDDEINKNQQINKNDQNIEQNQNDQNNQNNDKQLKDQSNEKQQNQEQINDIPSQPKVSVISGSRIIDFSNGVQKHSFQVKMIGYNKKKKKSFQIGETEEFMLFELLDQQVHFREIKIKKKQYGKTQFMANLYIKIQLIHNEQQFVDFWNNELNAREKQINKILKYIKDNPNLKEKSIEIRDKNESIMVDELNSFISRQNTFIFNSKSKSNTQSSNQSVPPDSVNSYYNIGFYMK